VRNTANARRCVVLRYRLQLEGRHVSASTINVRLAAVRRLAYEAAESGLLSPELAARIRRVKGLPLRVKVGHWVLLRNRAGTPTLTKAARPVKAVESSVRPAIRHWPDGILS